MKIKIGIFLLSSIAFVYPAQDANVAAIVAIAEQDRLAEMLVYADLLLELADSAPAPAPLTPSPAPAAPGYVVRHSRAQTGSKKPYEMMHKCNVCNKKSFADSSSLEKHMKNHPKCGRCNRFFSTDYTLKKHMNAHADFDHSSRLKLNN